MKTTLFINGKRTMPSPKVLLNSENLRAKKSLGQNFLTDVSVSETIVSKSRLTPFDVVLEIGAGLGALTVFAAKAAERVFAVEADRTLIPLLEKQLAAKKAGNVEIIRKSILRLNLEDLDLPSGTTLVVLGNLPYNISSQVLVYLIHNRRFVDRAVLMFQKELAERISAAPDSKDYGRLSVMLQYCAKTRILTEVPASSFFPRPKVDSAVLEVDFLDTLPFPAKNEAFLFQTIKAAFGKRRKTLKNALTQSQLPLDAGGVAQGLENAGIDPARRAETLSVEEFARLSDALGELADQG